MRVVPIGTALNSQNLIWFGAGVAPADDDLSQDDDVSEKDDLSGFAPAEDDDVPVKVHHDTRQVGGRAHACSYTAYTSI